MNKKYLCYINAVFQIVEGKMIRIGDRVYYVKGGGVCFFLLVTIAVPLLCLGLLRARQGAVDNGAVGIAFMACYLMIVLPANYLLFLYSYLPTVVGRASLVDPRNHYGERWYWFKCWLKRVRRRWWGYFLGGLLQLCGGSPLFLLRKLIHNLFVVDMYVII